MRRVEQRKRRNTWALGNSRPAAVYPRLGSPGTLRDESLRSSAFDPFSSRQLRLFGSRSSGRAA